MFLIFFEKWFIRMFYTFGEKKKTLSVRIRFSDQMNVNNNLNRTMQKICQTY